MCPTIWSIGSRVATRKSESLEVFIASGVDNSSAKDEREVLKPVIPELKWLSSLLKYVFLSEDATKPTIMSKSLATLE